MITINKIIYDVLNIARGGRISDDEKISLRQIELWINECRETLISQELSKGKEITDEVIQSLGCIELEFVDKSSCPELPAKCSILRSIKEIPRTIERIQRNTILSMESLDGERAFSQTTSFRSKWNKYNKFTSKESRWYIKDNRLFLTNEKRIKRLTATGIFGDPEEVANFNEGCWNRDSKYPVSLKMANVITDIVLKTKMGIEVSSPSDEINNASGEIKGTKIRE